jgi:hypothetical protein
LSIVSIFFIALFLYFKQYEQYTTIKKERFIHAA